MLPVILRKDQSSTGNGSGEFELLTHSHAQPAGYEKAGQ